MHIPTPAVRFILNRGIFILCLSVFPTRHIQAQAELMPWGNLNGIRIKGQLMGFNTSLNVAGKNWLKIISTGKELQNPKYSRKGKQQVVSTRLDDFQFTETVTDNGRGSVKLTIQCVSLIDTSAAEGIYFGLSLPADVYGASEVKVGKDKAIPLDQSKWRGEDGYLPGHAGSISFTTSAQSFRIRTTDTSSILIRQDTNVVKKWIQLYFPIGVGKFNKAEVFNETYEIQVSGKIDQSTIHMRLDPSVQGRPFDGLGGNFRLQNPKTDPEVIDYCLKNLRVSWGRVEMPWRNWQPKIDMDPLEASKNGVLDAHVKQSMEMAQRLSQMNIPIILTAWSPPAWAVTGRLQYGKSPAGIWGNPLNEAQMTLIYQSITEYLLYLKEHYGVEPRFFSFNESDLGINIRQTGEQHDELIKGLGAYFASKGLSTRVLLGDNSDANTYSFIYPAMDDPAARPFIGAISFHSWRGWDSTTLQKWADAAKQLRVPLIVAEGSIDAAAWAYPAFFEEQTYALEEINLYTRLLAICQPLSILQWQLTADYSPLAGGGIFGDNGPLRPTQRFWNLKQLSSTPPGLFNIPLVADKPDISCAALGDSAKHLYTLHIVNNGATRKLHITGLPAGLKGFTVYITNGKDDMKQMGSVKVKDQMADLDLDSRSFTTLISE